MPWLLVISQFYPAHQPQHLWVISGSKTSSSFLHSLSDFFQPSILSLFPKSPLCHLSPSWSWNSWSVLGPTQHGTCHLSSKHNHHQSTPCVQPLNGVYMSGGPRPSLVSSPTTSVTCLCSLIMPQHTSLPSREPALCSKACQPSVCLGLLPTLSPPGPSLLTIHCDFAFQPSLGTTIPKSQSSTALIHVALCLLCRPGAQGLAVSAPISRMLVSPSQWDRKVFRAKGQVLLFFLYNNI